MHNETYLVQHQTSLKFDTSRNSRHTELTNTELFVLQVFALRFLILAVKKKKKNRNLSIARAGPNFIKLL